MVENVIIFRQAILVLQDTAYDVDCSEVVSLVNFDVFGVFVLRKHKSQRALFQKIHASNLISFEKDVLFFCRYEWSQQRENPGYKR